MFLPVDHVIAEHLADDAEARQEAINKFKSALESAVKGAQNRERAVSTIGIRPTFPATGYGYLQAGNGTKLGVGQTQVRQGLGFAEKPDLAFAQKMLASGNYFWNAGMFVMQRDFGLELIGKHTPEIAAAMEKIREPLEVLKSNADPAAKAEAQRKIDAAYNGIPQSAAVSVDYGIMEKLKDELLTVAGTFPWFDEGDWASMTQRPDGNHNQLIGQGQFDTENSRNNVVYADQGKTVVVRGLEGHVVAVKNGRVLVMPKAKAAKVKELTRELKADAQTARFVDGVDLSAGQGLVKQVQSVNSEVTTDQGVVALFGVDGIKVTQQGNRVVVEKIGAQAPAVTAESRVKAWRRTLRLKSPRASRLLAGKIFTEKKAVVSGVVFMVLSLLGLGATIALGVTSLPFILFSAVSIIWAGGLIMLAPEFLGRLDNFKSSPGTMMTNVVMVASPVVLSSVILTYGIFGKWFQGLAAMGHGAGLLHIIGSAVAVIVAAAVSSSVSILSMLKVLQGMFLDVENRAARMGLPRYYNENAKTEEKKNKPGVKGMAEQFIPEKPQGEQAPGGKAEGLAEILNARVFWGDYRSQGQYHYVTADDLSYHEVMLALEKGMQRELLPKTEVVFGNYGLDYEGALGIPGASDQEKVEILEYKKALWKNVRTLIATEQNLPSWFLEATFTFFMSEGGRSFDAVRQRINSGSDLAAFIDKNMGQEEVEGRYLAAALLRGTVPGAETGGAITEQLPKTNKPGVKGMAEQFIPEKPQGKMARVIAPRAILWTAAIGFSMTMIGAILMLASSAFLTIGTIIALIGVATISLMNFIPQLKNGTRWWYTVGLWFLLFDWSEIARDKAQTSGWIIVSSVFWSWIALNELPRWLANIRKAVTAQTGKPANQAAKQSRVKGMAESFEPEKQQGNAGVGVRSGQRGFEIGRDNSDEAIDQLETLTGLTIAEIEKRARPLSHKGISVSGFIGANESFKAVLKRDNQRVHGFGMTHAQMAAPLKQAMAAGGGSFVFGGRRFYVESDLSRSPQHSIFNDELLAFSDYTIRDESGRHFTFSEMLPEYIERYGFYESTAYRLAPREIVAMFYPDQEKAVRPATESAAVAMDYRRVMPSEAIDRRIDEIGKGQRPGIGFSDPTADGEVRIEFGTKRVSLTGLTAFTAFEGQLYVAYLAASKGHTPAFLRLNGKAGTLTDLAQEQLPQRVQEEIGISLNGEVALQKIEEKNPAPSSVESHVVHVAVAPSKENQPNFILAGSTSQLKGTSQKSGEKPGLGVAVAMDIRKVMSIEDIDRRVREIRSMDRPWIEFSRPTDNGQMRIAYGVGGYQDIVVTGLTALTAFEGQLYVAYLDASKGNILSFLKLNGKLGGLPGTITNLTQTQLPQRVQEDFGITSNQVQGMAERFEVGGAALFNVDQPEHTAMYDDLTSLIEKVAGRYGWETVFANLEKRKNQAGSQDVAMIRRALEQLQAAGLDMGNLDELVNRILLLDAKASRLQKTQTMRDSQGNLQKKGLGRRAE